MTWAGGLAPGFARIGSALLRRAFDRESIMIYEAPTSSIAFLPAPVEIRRATHDLIQDLAWFHDPSELQTFRGFLDSGDTGYLAYLGGRCIHRSWYVPGPAEIHEHWSDSRPIAAAEGFVHYCKTAAEARGSGAFSNVLAQIAQDHLTTRTTMAIADGNTASRRAATKAGWTCIERVGYSVVLGIRTQRRSPMVSCT